METTIPSLQRRYNWTIPSRQRDAWRLLWPATGELLDTKVTILATDGLLALFTTDFETAFVGHLANFVGPKAKEWIDERDWDFQRNARVVKVFRRKAPLPPAVIPQDTFRDELLPPASRLTKVEHELFIAIADGTLKVEEFDEALSAATARRAEHSGKGKLTKKEILARI